MDGRMELSVSLSSTIAGLRVCACAVRVPFVSFAPRTHRRAQTLHVARNLFKCTCLASIRMGNASITFRLCVALHPVGIKIFALFRLRISQISFYFIQSIVSMTTKKLKRKRMNVSAANSWRNAGVE